MCASRALDSIRAQWGVYFGKFDIPEDAEDASVSECTWTLSALEALCNALYKFKTYLLTYFKDWNVSCSTMNFTCGRKTDR